MYIWMGRRHFQGNRPKRLIVVQKAVSSILTGGGGANKMICRTYNTLRPRANVHTPCNSIEQVSAAIIVSILGLLLLLLLFLLKCILKLLRSFPLMITVCGGAKEKRRLHHMNLPNEIFLYLGCLYKDKEFVATGRRFDQEKSGEIAVFF